MEPIQRQKCLDMIRQFLSENTPEVVRKMEKEDLYVWVSIKPFVALTFSTISDIYKLGMFTLANLTAHGPNRDLILSGDLRDDVISAAMYPAPCGVSYAQKILANYPYVYIPALRSIIMRKLLVPQ